MTPTSQISAPFGDSSSPMQIRQFFLDKCGVYLFAKISQFHKIPNSCWRALYYLGEEKKGELYLFIFIYYFTCNEKARLLLHPDVYNEIRLLKNSLQWWVWWNEWCLIITYLDFVIEMWTTVKDIFLKNWTAFLDH